MAIPSMPWQSWLKDRKDIHVTSDVSAKQAATSAFVGPEPATRINTTTVSTEIHRSANKEHQWVWESAAGYSQSRLFAYCLADATATLSCLASLKYRLLNLSGAGLPRLSWKHMALNGCLSDQQDFKFQEICSISSISIISAFSALTLFGWAAGRASGL